MLSGQHEEESVSTEYVSWKRGRENISTHLSSEQQATCSSNLQAFQTNIQAVRTAGAREAAAPLPYLYPSCSARLNKSHQAGSDSSHVDSVPNVVWRLGEHATGPSRASIRDVIPSLDGASGSLPRMFACARNGNALWHDGRGWHISPTLTSWSHQFESPRPSTSPPRSPFILSFFFSYFFSPALPCDLLHHCSHSHGSAAQNTHTHTPHTSPPPKTSHTNTPGEQQSTDKQTGVRPHSCSKPISGLTQAFPGYLPVWWLPGKACWSFCFPGSPADIFTQQNTLTEGHISFFVLMSASWWAALFEWVMRGGSLASAA